MAEVENNRWSSPVIKLNQQSCAISILFYWFKLSSFILFFFLFFSNSWNGDADMEKVKNSAAAYFKDIIVLFLLHSVLTGPRTTCSLPSCPSKRNNLSSPQVLYLIWRSSAVQREEGIRFICAFNYLFVTKSSIFSCFFFTCSSAASEWSGVAAILTGR